MKFKEGDIVQLLYKPDGFVGKFIEYKENWNDGIGCRVDWGKNSSCYGTQFGTISTEYLLNVWFANGRHVLSEVTRKGLYDEV